MLFLIPPGKFRVLDTWQTMGMRGTGSNTVIVEDVFVPREHTLQVADMREATTPGGKVNSGPIYRAPWITYAPLTFLAPMLGAARGALEDYRAWTAKRVSLFGAQVAEYTSIQVHLARSAATLDAAELLMRRCADVAQAPEPASEELRARAFRDQGRACELIVEAIDTVMKISGAAGFASSNNIQRAWRDVHFASSHVILNPEGSFAAWGRKELGLARDPKQNMF
jgi:3-hydroxy-9,10-secoandrosta-1,3,5(10)-triene-9,17-dione monooxygenase